MQPAATIKNIAIESPSELRDLVWVRTNFLWANGGEAWGHIPVRYPGSESCADGALKLARKTEWAEAGVESFTGLGQRILTTDAAEYSLLEVRRIELQPEA